MKQVHAHAQGLEQARVLHMCAGAGGWRAEGVEADTCVLGCDVEEARCGTEGSGSDSYQLLSSWGTWSAD